MARPRRPKQNNWRHLCTKIGAELVEGGLLRGARVRARLGPWHVILDTFTVYDRYSSTTYTRMRAPYVSPDGFRFTICRKGFWSALGKMLGMQDIEVGDPDFDDAFIVKGSNECKVVELFADSNLRSLIMVQPDIRLTVKDDEGWFGTRFPQGVDELYFQATGVIEDIERLERLFALFAATLERLCQIGAAYKEDPGLILS